MNIFCKMFVTCLLESDHMPVEIPYQFPQGKCRLILYRTTTVTISWRNMSEMIGTPMYIRKYEMLYRSTTENNVHNYHYWSQQMKRWVSSVGVWKMLQSVWRRPLRSVETRIAKTCLMPSAVLSLWSQTIEELSSHSKYTGSWHVLYSQRGLGVQKLHRKEEEDAGYKGRRDARWRNFEWTSTFCELPEIVLGCCPWNITP